MGDVAKAILNGIDFKNGKISGKRFAFRMTGTALSIVGGSLVEYSTRSPILGVGASTSTDLIFNTIENAHDAPSIPQTPPGYENVDFNFQKAFQ